MLLALLVSTALNAPAPSLYLDWRAPDGCPDPQWVVDEVKRLRGELDLRSLAAGAGLIARVSISETKGRWRAEIRTKNRGLPGQRIVDAETCQHAAETTALVLSVALADQLAQPQPPADVVAAAPAMPEPSPPVTTFAVGAAVLARSGPLPGAAVQAAVSVGVVRDPLRVEVTWFTPSTAQHIALPAAGAQLSLPLSGELAASVAVVEQAIELDFAVALVLGLVHGQGEGLAPSLAGDAGWVALEGGAVLRLPLWRGFTARVEGRVGASLLRPRFTIDGVEVYSAALLSARAAAGLEWIF